MPAASVASSKSIKEAEVREAGTYVGRSSAPLPRLSPCRSSSRSRRDSFSLLSLSTSSRSDATTDSASSAAACSRPAQASRISYSTSSSIRSRRDRFFIRKFSKAPRGEVAAGVVASEADRGRPARASRASTRSSGPIASADFSAESFFSIIATGPRRASSRNWTLLDATTSILSLSFAPRASSSCCAISQLFSVAADNRSSVS
mmetsp:Transcript_8053/g.17433  ORF Transcript_8053/g.17433 Transcript_8053/m.17433 type:complete len:204 (+) Transcript_8053:643-1254(+)